MTTSHPDHPQTRVEAMTPAEREALLRTVMSRQAALGLQIGAVFLSLLLGLPLVNWLAPGLANAPVGGFTASWLFLGILFYPITWVLSKVFIAASNRIEEELAAGRYPGEGPR